MDQLPDEHLLERYAESGELRFFDALTRRHIGKVRAMIYPMVLNDADADELTQEVFLRVIGGIEGFRRGAAFSTWLHRITMNTANSFLARKSRNPVETRECPPDPPAALAWNPASAVMAAENGSRVGDALKVLSPRLRAAIVLTAIHGFSLKEAADAERCLVATMYWRVHQARKELRQILDEGGGE